MNSRYCVKSSSYPVGRLPKLSTNMQMTRNWYRYCKMTNNTSATLLFPNGLVSGSVKALARI